MPSFKFSSFKSDIYILCIDFVAPFLRAATVVLRKIANVIADQKMEK